MNMWIALFKGINVGGNNLLPMKDLVITLTELGFLNVKSYIQSGNVVFQSPLKDAAKLARLIDQAVWNKFNIKPPVLVLSHNAFSKSIQNNPFEVSDAEAKFLHLFFTFKPTETLDEGRLAATQKINERCALRDGVFYLHAPDGIGQSKLATQVEKVVGVPVTARNWRTVCAISALLEDLR